MSSNSAVTDVAVGAGFTVSIEMTGCHCAVFSALLILLGGAASGSFPKGMPNNAPKTQALTQKEVVG